MVQAAESRVRNNTTASCRTNSAARRLLAQPEVGAIVVEIANVIAQKSLQMGFIESDDMVEHIAAAASDPALGNAVLPRAVDRGTPCSWNEWPQELPARTSGRDQKGGIWERTDRETPHVTAERSNYWWDAE